jgi:hypothetical protein
MPATDELPVVQPSPGTTDAEWLYVKRGAVVCA